MAYIHKALNEVEALNNILNFQRNGQQFDGC